MSLADSRQSDIALPSGWRIWSLTWARDRKALFVTADMTTYFVARIDLDGNSRVLFDAGRAHWLSDARRFQEGRHLALTQRTDESNAWLLENF